METIKEAKKMEFPVAPVSHESKKKSAGGSGKKPSEDHSEMVKSGEKKKDSKLKRLMAMMEAMGDSDDE